MSHQSDPVFAMWPGAKQREYFENRELLRAAGRPMLVFQPIYYLLILCLRFWAWFVAHFDVQLVRTPTIREYLYSYLFALANGVSVHLRAQTDSRLLDKASRRYLRIRWLGNSVTAMWELDTLAFEPIDLRGLLHFCLQVSYYGSPPPMIEQRLIADYLEDLRSGQVSLPRFRKLSEQSTDTELCFEAVAQS